VNASNPPSGANGKGRPPPGGFGQPAQPAPGNPFQPAPAQRPAAASSQQSSQSQSAPTQRPPAPPRPPAQAAQPAAAAPRAAPQSSAAPKPSPAAATPPDTGRAVAGAGEPYPPLQAGALETPTLDPKRFPRSARAALEPARVPAPKKRSRRARHPFVIVGNLLLTLMFLTTIAAGVGFVIGKQRFDLPGPLASDKVVNIPRGGVRDTAELLQREGVIDQPYLFMAGALLIKARNDLKSGEYRFEKNASLMDVVDTIIEGKVVQHAFTVAEGLTSDQIVQRLLENDVLSGNIREVPREGTLMPETYRFTRGTTREQMIQRMQQQHRRAVQEIWDRRMPDLPLRSAEQLVVLASIVEKETGKVEERTRVAAVFVNRLKQKMKLQSDPTIIYGLVGGKGTLGRGILKSEIEQPTPYNTYVIDGLPPGPIANPGRASLEAAANPARTKELFFVADGSGGHAFADSYEQHQKNVAKLRAIERETNPQPAAATGRSPARAARPATRQ
jgi:UPF0755 protein